MHKEMLQIGFKTKPPCKLENAPSMLEIKIAHQIRKSRHSCKTSQFKPGKFKVKLTSMSMEVSLYSSLWNTQPKIS
jgi:hypothetical protein